MAIHLSDEVVAFLREPHHAVLATINPDGMPQQTVLWYEFQGDVVLMNTAAGRLKDRNLRRDPRASVCVVGDTRAVTFRGRIALIDDQHVAQADIKRLAVRYNGPEVAERQAREQFTHEHRVTLLLEITHVVLQGFE
jgi:PPOX class probable F420-dependent enzyme